MEYSHEVQNMCCVAKGPNHGPAPIPEEGKWVQAKEIKDISGLTHGVGWCAPQQGACKLTLNVKEGVIEECLVETIGCSGMTHSAAMASEILPGKTILEALNTDLVCDAINTAMRELFLQIVYGRTQSAFSEGGLVIGAGLEDLGKGLISQMGTLYGTKVKGARYLQLTEGYITKMYLDKDDQVCGYEFVHMGKFMDAVNGKLPPQTSKKLLKMICEIYEDGTNEVQDIIGVTILGEMKNDKALMAIADKYMSDYMSGPVHEINKITQKNNSLTKKLKNPPPYKPKKKKNSIMQSALQQQNINR